MYIATVYRVQNPKSSQPPSNDSTGSLLVLACKSTPKPARCGQTCSTNTPFYTSTGTIYCCDIKLYGPFKHSSFWCEVGETNQHNVKLNKEAAPWLLVDKQTETRRTEVVKAQWTHERLNRTALWVGRDLGGMVWGWGGLRPLTWAVDLTNTLLFQWYQECSGPNMRSSSSGSYLSLRHDLLRLLLLSTSTSLRMLRLSIAGAAGRI
jgi:hypothetical protein